MLSTKHRTPKKTKTVRVSLTFRPAEEPLQSRGTDHGTGHRGDRLTWSPNDLSVAVHLGGAAPSVRPKEKKGSKIHVAFSMGKWCEGIGL